MLSVRNRVLAAVGALVATVGNVLASAPAHAMLLPIERPLVLADTASAAPHQR